MNDLFPPEVLLALGVTLAAGLATTFGSLFVLGASTSNSRLLSIALAFSGGAMIYVSLVEIFAKSVTSLTESYGDKGGYAVATASFFAGIAVLVLLDRVIKNPHPALDRKGVVRDDKETLARVGLITAAAITAHNLPEGLATFLATLENPTVGLTLAMAIALHNVPEGVSIAVPIYYLTGSRWKAFFASFGAGFAEPLGALIGYLVLAPFLSPVVFGVMFGMIAGVMVFLALDELLPTAKRYSVGHDTAYAMVGGMGVMAASLVLLR